ncbi:MAG: hypothetical protein ACD_5C00123G0001 [uncultured bacterium]|nr:MAG: hypothetical protein ACD_5C00123G0001 [uncultured bacterium]
MSSTCQRAKCGAIIVKDGQVIGKGSNSFPGNDERQCRCSNSKDDYDKKVTDKTCCVHAEQRAVMDALKNNADKLEGSRLYFARFHSDGEGSLLGGERQLYCTICTKMMYDVGIAEFILPHRDGICVYPKDEYLNNSYDYGKIND